MHRNQRVAHMHRSCFPPVMNARFALVAILLAMIAPARTASAGGWTQPEGAYYAKVWNRTLVGRRAFVTERTTARLPEPYQDHQLNIYGEYGITDEFTLTLNSTALGFATFGDESRVYSAGGALGLRYRMTEGAISSAVEVQAGLRPGSGLLGSGTVQVDRGGVVETDDFIAEPSVGTGYGSLDFQVGYGLSFFWLAATGGLRAFTNTELKPAFYINTQIGWITRIGLMLDLHFNWHHSTGSIDRINMYGAGQTRYLGFGLGASWWLTDHFAINAGLDGVFFATANAATPSVLLGVEFK